MIDITNNFKKPNEFHADDLVCFCFGHTKKDIENDFNANGISRIYEKIADEKKSGNCNCAKMNPKGR